MTLEIGNITLPHRSGEDMTPAKYIVKQFGGVRKAARACGVTHPSVLRWLQPKSEGGTGGRIPSIRYEPILKEAEKQGLDITMDNLIYGDKIPMRRTA